MNEGIIAITIIIVLLCWFGGWLAITSYQDKMREIQSLNSELSNLDIKIPIECIKYSNDMLDFIKSMVTQVSILKFNIFIDAYIKEKIARVHLEDLVKEVATEVRISLDYSKFKTDMLLYSKDFIDNYIVETSMMIVKGLWEKEFDN